MIRVLAVSLGLVGLVACSTVQAPIAPQSAEAALNLYYAGIDADALPKASPMKALPGNDVPLQRILVGSCVDEELSAPALQTMASRAPDLMLLIGDNVYGDVDGRTYKNNDPDLTELRESFAELATRPEFIAARAAAPMLAVWDDHDYGVNDGGREFAFRGLAEKMHETFWGVPDAVKARPGVYDSYVFGPEGQRVQIILLDTRFFRSPLTPTDEWGVKGKERYLPAPAGSPQDMLGDAQWQWLEAELRKPADVRLLVSSIQVIPDVHGWESWNKMPDERQRLFDVIAETRAKGVVFVSGDRHTAFLYRDADILPYPAMELTASSVNKSFSETSDEVDENQIGPGYSLTNFGEIAIDWTGRSIALSILSETGETVRSTRVGFAEIGLN